MILFKTRVDLRKYLDSQRASGIKIGFVPTMGALHDGHISLISQARHDNQLVISSLFVNPTQFNDPADFKKYPATLESDIQKLENAACDILFLPSVNEIYPGGTSEKIHYDIGYLESILEGQYRPGHFQGVCRVVDILLQIVQPDQLYIGQKDYQQCMVIRRLLVLTGMDKTTGIHISPTLREPDGLAMSSRNMRLDAGARRQANGIYQALTNMRKDLRPGNLASLKEDALAFLTGKGFKPDYVEIAQANDLTLVNNWDGKQKLVALVAAYLNGVRLIDNMLLN